jgi:hypothetical protein
MFEKLGRLAEAAASSVGASRRGFLGRMGRAALGMAGVVAGLLALPAVSPAQGGVLCCKYQCRVGYLCNKVKERGPVQPTPLPLPSVGSAAQSRRNANADPVAAWIGARRRSRPDRVGRTRSGLGWPALPACRRGAVRFSQPGVSGGCRNECSQTLAGTPLREKKFVSLVPVPLQNATGHPQRIRGSERIGSSSTGIGPGQAACSSTLPLWPGIRRPGHNRPPGGRGCCKPPDPRDGRSRSSGSRRPGGTPGPP